MPPKPLTLSERFLATYNQFDDYMRARLNQTPVPAHRNLIPELVAVEPFAGPFQRKLEAFAKLRNSIVHDSLPDRNPIAEPHQNVVEDYEEILHLLLHPPGVMTVGVELSEIFTTEWDRHAVDVIATMNAKVYTHVPILSKGAVIGVFSENTVFSYLAERRGAVIGAWTQIGEFRDYVPVAKHASEVFDFLPRSAHVADALARFRDSIRDKKRLAALFVTDDGLPDGQLTGMVTAWDLAKANLCVPSSVSGQASRADGAANKG